jgi:TPR repeat protein
MKNLSLLTCFLFLFVACSGAAKTKKNNMPRASAGTTKPAFSGNSASGKNQPGGVPAGTPVMGLVPVDPGQLLEKTPAETPEWKNHSTESMIGCGDSLCFIGDVEGPQKEKVRQEALKKALGKVGTQMGIQVSSSQKIYTEAVNGAVNDLMIEATTITGTPFRLKGFAYEEYVEKWRRDGKTVYVAYSKVAVPKDKFADLRTKASAKTRWGVIQGGSCTIGEELDPYLKNVGTRLGYVMNASPAKITDKKAVEKLAGEKDVAFLLVLTPRCKKGAHANVTLVLDQHDVIQGGGIISSESATAKGKGESTEEALELALEMAQKKLAGKLFEWNGAGLFELQLDAAPIDDELAKVSPELHGKYVEARDMDREGWLFPKATVKAWEAIVNAPDPNPYRATARKRMEIWKTYIARRGELAKARTIQRKNLAKDLGSESFKPADTAPHLINYIYTFASIYGARDVIKLFESIPEREKSAELHKLVFSEGRMKKWDIACNRHDGAACYFAGLGDAKRRKEYYAKACDAQIGAACHSMAKAHSKSTDKSKSMDYAKKACRFGKRHSCFLAGQLGYKGWSIPGGVRYEMEAARSYLEKACKAGNKGGCGYLCWEYSKGQEKEFGKGKQRLGNTRRTCKKACDLGHGKSCEILKGVESGRAKPRTDKDEWDF